MQFKQLNKENGWQTREHAQLARTLNVEKLMTVQSCQSFKNKRQKI